MNLRKTFNKDHRRVQTVYLLIPELRGPGGFEGQLVALACGLKASGLDIFVLSRQPISADHPGFLQMKRAGVHVFFPASWLYRLSEIRWRKKVVDGLALLSSPLVLAGVLVARLVYRKSFAQLWRGANYRLRKQLGRALLRDWGTDLYFALLDRTAQRQPPDIVDVQHSCLPEGLKWAHTRHWPVVYTEYGAPDEECLPGVWKPLEGVINYAAFIMGRSEASLEGLQRICGANRPSIVVPNAVINAPALADLVEPEHNNPIVITVIGRLAPEKGLHYLLEAFRILVGQGLKARLVFAGDGSLRGSLKDQVDAWNLKDAVQFTGVFTELPPIMKASHIVAHPTLNDGRSVSVLEAMAWSKPVIASRIGGVTELVEDNVTGLLVPPKNPVALAEALKRLALDPEARHRMGQAGRARFLLGQYTLESMINSVQKVYDQVTQNFHHV